MYSKIFYKIMYITTSKDVYNIVCLYDTFDFLVF